MVHFAKNLLRKWFANEKMVTVNGKQKKNGILSGKNVLKTVFTIRKFENVLEKY